MIELTKPQCNNFIKFKSDSYEKILIAFVIVVIPFFAFVNPWISIILAYIMLIILLFSDYKYSLIYFIFYSFLQNIVLVYASTKFNQLTTTLYSLNKEILLYAVTVRYIFSQRFKYSITNILMALFMFLLLFSFVTSSASFYSKILTIRQLLLPFVCVYFGVCVGKENSLFFKKSVKYIVYLGLFTAIIGLLEFFWLKNTLWPYEMIFQYETNKGTVFVFYNNVPLNYYTWDYYDIFGGVVRRLVSTFADPLITGHYLFLSFVLCSSDSCTIKYKPLVKFILFISSLLTFSKGVFICYLIYFIFIYLKKKSYLKFKTLLTFFPIALLFSVLILNIAAKSIIPNSSVVIHLDGFISGIFDSSVFGYGIGKAGVMTYVVGGGDLNLTSESFIGVLTIQLGYLGLLIFVLYFYFLILNLFHNYRENKSINIILSLVLLCSVLVESLFSESSIGIVGTGIYFIYSGIYSTKRSE